MIQSNGGQFFIGVVEDRNDPLMLGRVRARVVGLHTHDKTYLPTDDLPWAMLMQPAAGGTGAPAIGPAEGTTVIVIFNDYPSCQQPIVIGALAGVPQGQPVNIDKFEDTPMFRDGITPQGRQIPVNHTTATANQIGPVTAPNPVLEQIVTQSTEESSSTPSGVISNLLNGTGRSMQSVGGMLGGIAGIGSSYSLAKNTFEDLLLGSGNKDSAIDRFKLLATQSGPLGNGITTILNGKATLKNLEGMFDLSLDRIQDSFRNISDAGDLLGAITNAEQLAYQIGQLSTDTSGTLGAIFGEVSQVTLGSTVSAVEGDVGSFLGGLFGELGGVVGGGLNQLDVVTGILGIGSISGAAQSTINQVVNIFETPSSVAEILNTGFSSNAAAKVQAGGVTRLQSTLIEDVDSTTFEGVAEGCTPPVNGVFGGPNFAGASPVLEMPTQDMSLYEGGSERALVEEPPPYFQGNKLQATKGIQALLNACSKYGLSTNEQKASLLAIVGGECGWVPKAESCQYSDPARLMQIFPSTFRGKRDLAVTYCNWTGGSKGQPEDFFNFVYDPANNGRQLGNSQPGDGGRYYGRGFIQLTGRQNYERYALLSGYPIDEEPDLLIDEINISAEIAVLYLMDRVKGAIPTSHPHYFYAAKKAVGNNSADIAARKLAYYEHFYGTKTPETYGYGMKTAGNSMNSYSYYGSVSGNEAGKINTSGFCDPHGKYPLKRQIEEQEVNRLARGVAQETIVMLKESQRTTGVPIAMNGGSFSQPPVPYGAKYPYNRVMETESGHVQEFDDTPGYERVHTYHRSGTFEEIDVNGTKVTKIVGDGYVIMDRNGFISIAGDAYVTVSGNINILCRSDANIEVAGSAEMKVGGNFDIGVARDMNIACEGNFSLWANGTMNLQSKVKGHILTGDNLYIASNKQIHMQSTEDMFILSKKNAHIKTLEDLYTLSIKETHIKSTEDMYIDSHKNAYVSTSESLRTTSSKSTHIRSLSENVNIQSKTPLNIKSEAALNIESQGTMNLKATGGDIVQQGSQILLNSSTPASADSATVAISSLAPVIDATKALVHGMVPPALGTPIYPTFEPITSPPMFGEEKYMYELPEDGQTNASVQYNQERTAQEGKSNLVESERASGSGGAGSITPSPLQEKILAMDTFTADFKLSEHFNLGMMFDGGFNVRHRLIDQNGLTRQQIVSNLAALCENILEKYLEFLPDGIQGYGKKWRISSGYRMGTNTSDHSKGRACDITLLGGNERKKLHFDLIQQLDKAVPYDQLILEYEGNYSTWIHTGFRGDGATFGGGNNRGMSFTMNNHTTYGQGFILLG